MVQAWSTGRGSSTPPRTPVFGYLHLANLTRGTTYTFRVYSVPVRGPRLHDQPPVRADVVHHLPAPDSVPPRSRQGRLASSTTTTFTTLSWVSSTDNVQVTGYDVQELENGTWTTIATPAP